MKAAILPLLFGALLVRETAHAWPAPNQSQQFNLPPTPDKWLSHASMAATPWIPAPVSPVSGGRDDWQGDPTWNTSRMGRWGEAYDYRPRPDLRVVYQYRQYDHYRAQHYRYWNSRYYSSVRFQHGAYAWPRGYGTGQWVVGHYLPSPFYHDRRYDLGSYWNYRLYTPPPDCRWVRVADNALLISRYDGAVLDVIYNMFW